MASRYYGINLGLDATTVTDGASTTSKAIEVVVDLTNNPTRLQVIKALELIEDYIVKTNWPPA